MVVDPSTGTGFYGIAIDGYTTPSGDGGASTPIQQVWLGGVGESAAYRYRPVRTAGFDGYGKGTWAKVVFSGGVSQGRGIGVDNRNPTSFAWVALDGGVSKTQGAIGRIPVNIPDGLTTLAAAGNAASTGQSGTLGAGVAFDLDIWGINQGSSSATHFKVDAKGDFVGSPDVIPLDDKPSADETFCGATQCKPHPYTYSDFTGFGLRNFTNPHGEYQWVQTGCSQGDTKWLKVIWSGDTPTGTAISVRVRSADTVAALSSATWTGTYKTSPADLAVAPGPLSPNPAKFAQVAFELTTTTDGQTPRLKGFQVVYECLVDAGPPH
jgi:hypothetical protein